MRDNDSSSEPSAAFGVQGAWGRQPFAMAVDKRRRAGSTDRERLNRSLEIEIPWSERERLDRRQDAKVRRRLLDVNRTKCPSQQPSVDIAGTRNHLPGAERRRIVHRHSLKPGAVERRTPLERNHLRIGSWKKAGGLNHRRDAKRMASREQSTLETPLIPDGDCNAQGNNRVGHQRIRKSSTRCTRHNLGHQERPPCPQQPPPVADCAASDFHPCVSKLADASRCERRCHKGTRAGPGHRRGPKPLFAEPLDRADMKCREARASLERDAERWIERQRDVAFMQIISRMDESAHVPACDTAEPKCQRPASTS